MTSKPRLSQRFGLILLAIGTFQVFMGGASVASALLLDVGDAKTGLTIAGVIGIALGFACALTGNLIIQRARLMREGPPTASLKDGRGESAR